MSIKEKKFTKLDVVSGKSYFICQCGQSAKYPLCDGSHKNTSFSPEKYVASANASVSVCECNDLKTVVCDCG
ncbi:CDGSH iron-sulfur domain-containing protein [Paracoccaceae bacterium]|nr:CDGSH iron-sulfur domain-containing protein [Paracoccaceae bacterium]MDC3092575.1 CDGSH iron-sulfur domain-containing protein [Paracoccaceae bacterium]